MASSPVEAYAILIGLSGLLPNNVDPTWDKETHRFIRAIWDFWWKQGDELKDLTLSKSEWTLAGIRPANHPIRRLMASAFYAFEIPELIDHAEKLTEQHDSFWNTHINWKTSCEPTALVGQSRANAMITNIFIPFQAAIGRTEIELGRLPAEPTNSIIRQTAYTLFGPDHTPRVYQSALARQGLIQIFHDYVITHRLDELREIFGGTTSSLSETDDEDIVPPFPKRKRPAHHSPVEIPNRLPIIFLTVCSHNRRTILATKRFHQTLTAAWRAADRWIVGRYVVMPNHIHLFCAPARVEAVSVSNWVEYWKRIVSQQLPDLQPIWQRDFWDTQLRCHESYTEKWEYVMQNPVRAGLVSTAEDWPYQGTLNHLPW